VLELNEVEPLLRCKKCNHQFHGHHLPDVCPQCGSVEVLAVNPTDMVLESFEIER
jgi:Zn finger protein HypA/HybF involved in hydrogenase expression